MESVPKLPKELNVDSIVFGNIKALDSGGKSIPAGIDGKPIIIQTPEMPAPFGMSKWNADKSDKEKLTLEMSFKNKDANKSQAYFFEFLQKLDARFITEGMNNSTAWFKKKYSTPEVVEALYTPMVKFPKDKDTGEITDKYPPTFRLNLAQKDGKFAFPVYNKKGEEINITDIEKGSKVTAIIQFLGGWLAGGKYGGSWKVVQLMVDTPQAIKGFAFRDIEVEKEENINDDDDDAACISADVEDSIPPNVGDDVHIESSSSEEDAIDGPPKKTVVAKKKK